VILLLARTVEAWAQDAAHDALNDIEREKGVVALPLKVRTWRIEDGLPLGVFGRLAEDDRGFLWIAGTHDGLYRFDGTGFAVAGNDLVSPEPYPGDRDVSAIAAGRSGLWVGTSTSGLWRLDHGHWERFRARDGLASDSITALEVADLGIAWVGTANGLSRIQGKSITVLGPAQGVPEGAITAVHQDRKGVVSIAVDGEIYHKSRDRFRLIRRRGDWPAEPVYAILERSDGAIWLGSWSGGLARLHGKDVRVYRDHGGLRRSDQPILSLVEDRWGSIWIGTRGGLFVLKHAGDQNQGLIQKVDSQAVYSLFRDSEGTIWASTLGGLEQDRDWRLPVLCESRRIRSENVESVHEAEGGGIWAALDNGGVVHYQNGRIVETVRMEQGLSSDDAKSVELGRGGAIYVGTWGHGVNRIEKGVASPFPADGIHGEDIVRSIVESANGDLWVGTWGAGLRHDHAGKVRTYTIRDGLADDHVRVLLEDGQALWIATHKRLSRLENSVICSYTTADGLAENSIFALHKGSDGSLWIGTWGGGLNRYRNGRFTAYTSRDGLPSDTICSILKDDRGRLWCGSVRGIVRISITALDAFDRRQLKILPCLLLGKAEGMISAQCNRGTQPSACRTADGQLWFATIHGIVVIDPHAEPMTSEPPRTFLLRTERDHGQLESSGSGWLARGPHDISFHYTTSSRIDPEKIHFQYRLKGFYPDWIEAGAERVARFSNLPPGQYEFLARARIGDGPWGPIAGGSPLLIQSAWTETAAFRAAILALAAALIWLLAWIRIVRIRNHERLLEALVEERTAEVRAAQATAEKASSAKDRFLAVLSHELRTPLTPVLLSVSCLLEDEDDPIVRDQLEMIRRNVQLEARLVDDLLDLSRIERGSLHLEIRQVDVHEAIDRSIDVCSGEVKCAGLAVISRLHAPHHHVEGDFIRLQQIFWNLICNAARFTGQGSSLVISTRNEPPREPGQTPWLIVEFRDSGIGIDPSQLESIFNPFEQACAPSRARRAGLGLGLAISRWVAEAQGGKLIAQSPGLGHGDTFRLELPTTRISSQSSRESSSRGPAMIPCAGLDVLLVEDNPDTLYFLCMVLRRMGHQVVTASSLAEARQAVARNRFDLLLCDIQLPDGSGLEFMRELKADQVATGVSLSGFGTEDDHLESQRAGFTLHLVKPILAEDLRAALETLQAQRSQRDGGGPIAPCRKGDAPLAALARKG